MQSCQFTCALQTVDGAETKHVCLKNTLIYSSNIFNQNAYFLQHWKQTTFIRTHAVDTEIEDNLVLMQFHCCNKYMILHRFSTLFFSSFEL